MDFIATQNRIQSLINIIVPCDCSLCLMPITAQYKPLQICQYCFHDLPTYPLSWDIKLHDPKANSQIISDHVSGITAVGHYEWPFDYVLQQLKFHGKLWHARTVGALLSAQLDHLNWPRIDIMCPLPLHPKRQLKRGFNQAQLIAKHIPAMHRKLNGNLLARTIYSLPQSELGRQQRLLNVKDIFHCEQNLTDKTVLLIDDVLTTGATIDNAAKALLEANATAVFAAVAAIRVMR